MDEICRNCGDSRFVHIDLKLYPNADTNYGVYLALKQEMVNKFNLYGNACFNFQLDNLKFIEEAAYQKDSEQHNREMSLEAKSVN